MGRFRAIQAALEDPEPGAEDVLFPELGEPLLSPLWVTPLKSFAIKGDVYQWYRFTMPKGADDFEIEQIGTTHGRWPLWVMHEDLDEVLKQDYGRGQNQFMDLALREGLSLGQPFLIRFDKPIGHYSYEGDYDVEYNWEIVRKLPVRFSSAAKSWENVLRRIEFEHQRVERYRQHVERMSIEHSHRWKVELKFDTYSDSLMMTLFYHPPAKMRIGGWSLMPPYYEEGRAVRLLRVHTPVKRDETVSDYNSPLFWQLVEAFRKRYPDQDVSPLLALAPSGVQISRMDRLLLTWIV